MFSRIGSGIRSHFWNITATLILAILVFLADLDKILVAAGSAEVSLLVLAVLAGVLNLVFRTFNWILFFRIEDIESRVLRTFQLFSASRFLNLVTPLGQFGGEPVMAYLISKESDTSYGNALATIMTATWVVLFPISFFALAGYSYLAFNGSMTAQVQYSSMVVAVLAAFGLFMGYLGWFHPRSFRKSMDMVSAVIGFVARKEDLSIHEKLDGFFDHLENSFDKIRQNPGPFALSIVIITVAYSFLILAFYFTVHSLGIELAIFHAMIMLPIASVANISPTPGGTGTVEATLTALITLFTGAELATALTAVILYRVATYWVGIVTGYIGMATLDLDHSRLKKHVPR